VIGVAASKAQMQELSLAVERSQRWRVQVVLLDRQPETDISWDDLLEGASSLVS
jgi:hypothetical protein